MILKQIQSKRYWLRVAGSFIWFLVTYTLVLYFFREANEPFWNIDEIQSRLGFAFFMSIIFAYRQREQPKPDLTEDDDMIETGWSFKHFMSVFRLMLLFSLLIMSVLFGIGCIVMHLFNDKVEPVGNVFVKMLAVTSTMTFIAVIILYFSDRFSRPLKRRS